MAKGEAQKEVLLKFHLTVGGVQDEDIVPGCRFNYPIWTCVPALVVSSYKKRAVSSNLHNCNVAWSTRSGRSLSWIQREAETFCISSKSAAKATNIGVLLIEETLPEAVKVGQRRLRACHAISDPAKRQRPLPPISCGPLICSRCWNGATRFRMVRGWRLPIRDRPWSSDYACGPKTQIVRGDLIPLGVIGTLERFRSEFLSH